LVKKAFAALAACILILSSAGPSQSAGTPQTVSVTHSLATVEIPRDPARVAILDMSALDMMDAFGVGSRVTGVPKGSTVSYLAAYINNPGLVNLGNLKEVDMESLNSSAPDVIFIGGRLRAEHENLSRIAPTVLVMIDNTKGYMAEFKRNVEMVASVFGTESKAKELLSGFDSRVDALSKAARGKTAIVGIVTSGSFNALGKGGRCSIITNEIGFENLAAPDSGGKGSPAPTHGDSASFEFLLEKNPDYIFVLDRDSAISAKGSRMAREIMENDIIKKTRAYQDGHIVYLTPDVWYLAEGGITATDTMLKDLEAGVLGR
jgi:iron complex transport system substrate-binding protein